MEKSLNVQTLNQAESKLTDTVVKVGLPKFTITSQFDLGGTLASMGMPSAFDKHRANFSGMDGQGDLFISEVIHKAFINVDEQGTEAAAATSVGLSLTCVLEPPPPQAVFDADQPFDFLIRDDKSGSILFMGRVSDPGGTPIVSPLPEDTFFSSSQRIDAPTALSLSDLAPIGTSAHAITAVPEPSSWALLLAASIALATLARRRAR